MAFTGKEDHSISLQDAADLTRNYRNATLVGIKGHFFGKDTIERILAQEGCVGLRLYHAVENGNHTLVMVGTDAKEDDLVNGEIAQFAPPCPPNCGQLNALNS